MLLAFKEEVFEATLSLVENNLTLFTWGSASAIDRTKGVIAIKPTGIPYEDMRPGDMVVLDLNGEVVDGKLTPSLDTEMHLALYKRYPSIGGIVHTRSSAATSWAQAGAAIPVLGTTHADYFKGEIPCTRPLEANEINGNYEKETAKVILERLSKPGANPLEVPAVLVCSRGPLVWGYNVKDAVRNARVLEAVAGLALQTSGINPVFPLNKDMIAVHYNRRNNIL